MYSHQTASPKLLIDLFIYFFFLAAVAVAGLADALMGPTGKVLPKKALPE